MVALLSSDPIDRLDTLAPPAAPPHRARHLQLLPSPDAGTRPVPGALARSDRWAARLWVAAALVVALLAFAALRVVQQAPPAGSWAEAHRGIVEPEPVDPAVGESVRIVQVGETLWGIAGELAPGADRREVVQRLAERNGGSHLLAGQTLIIPAAVGNP